MNINSILVVADPPDRRQTAVRRAIDIARSCKARLLLAGFVWDAAAEDRNMLTAIERKAVRSALMDQKRAMLAELAEEAEAAGVKCRIRAIWSRALHQWVVDHSEGHDLVVKSANRTRSLTHTPTDWHLMRDCPVPLLETVKVRWPKRARIIATLDLGNNSGAQKRLNRRVMDAAVTFANIREAELHVCYTIQASTILTELDIIDPGEYARRVRKRIEPQLEALSRDWDVPADNIHLPVGDVDTEINSLADRIKAEVVVMGTAARKGLSALTIGNTAERVLASANTDVLTVKPAPTPRERVVGRMLARTADTALHAGRARERPNTP